MGVWAPCYPNCMASKRKTRREVLSESRRRGYLAGGAAVATGVATVTVGFVPLGAVGLGATGWFTWKWLAHRVKNGIRF